MSDYVKPPRKSLFGDKAKAAKGAYAYLHPRYRIRKLVELIVVVPVVLFVYTIIYGWVIMSWTPSIIDTIVIFALVIISAYFYPFSYWWYKKTFGDEIDNMVLVGTSVLRLLGKRGWIMIAGIIVSGLLSPITGPLTLRKCRRENLIIGEEKDFNSEG